MKQLSLFDRMGGGDSVIIEVAKRFGFSIQHHITDADEMVYSVQDWIIGVTSTPHARNFWRQFKSRLDKSGDSELYTRCSQLPYLASNGKTYQMDYADDVTLFEMTGRMDVATGVRNEVLQYMAKSAAFVDKMRHNKRDVAALLNQMADAESSATGKDAEWLAARAKGVQSRNSFTSVVHGANPDVNIGQATNDVYQGVFGMKAGKLREVLQIGVRGNPRDHMGTLALAYVGVCEAAISTQLRDFADNDVVPVYVVHQIVQTMAKLTGTQAQDMAAYLKIDLLTGSALLPKAK